MLSRWVAHGVTATPDDPTIKSINEITNDTTEALISALSGLVGMAAVCFARRRRGPSYRFGKGVHANPVWS